MCDDDAHKGSREKEETRGGLRAHVERRRKGPLWPWVDEKQERAREWLCSRVVENS